ncbi:MAG: universal stress protein [Desulfatitalea sp.]|nr:universal stress protein [Desulfatitalea sp.]NNK01922.1 universal stress protein [Desulfatitalea sp.]
MKTILLAVDGMSAHQSALDYALDLCNPVRAGLDILQIIVPRKYPAGLSRFKQSIYRARNLVEDAMVTATFAQAGAPELSDTLRAAAERRFKQMLPPHVTAAVDYHCVVTSEDPDAVLKRYVDDHRNIILAIYDSLRFGRKPGPASAPARGIVSGLLNKLSIPLVLVEELRTGSSGGGQRGNFI